MPATSQSSEGKFDFFFYGTLCHPAILVRVLRHQGNDLLFQDAILPNYTRHHVKNEDYPAVIHRDAARELLGEQSQGQSQSNGISDESDERWSTRGTVVRGLTYSDVLALDMFEGHQYSRRRLPVRTLSVPSHSFEVPGSISKTPNRSEAPSSNEGQEQSSSQSDREQEQSELDEVWVYVWSDDVHHLEPKIWDFATFMKDKAHLWTGPNTTEYDDVDRLHALALKEEPNGAEVEAEHEVTLSTTGAEAVSPVVENGVLLDDGVVQGQKVEGYPDFGHGMLKHWGFKEGYLNFNNGSYGSPPLPVLSAMRSLSEQCESNPDLFMRRSYPPHLTKARTRIAELINADMNEVVIVPGATHGMNTVLREIDWAEGDVILAYNTTYGAVGQTIKYLTDRIPTLSLQNIDLQFPLPHAEILAKTEETIQELNIPCKPNYTGQAKPAGHGVKKRIRALIIDQIASQPGVVFPWEDLVRMCKKYGILSIVDAAHAIGQVKTDIKLSDPDFWVSNCHKWLYAHRACAALYVPLRNQRMIRSSMPTGHGYESARYPTPGVDRHWTFAGQFDWVGTQDWAPFFSVNAALDFRDEIGGEERIMTYCHSLAVAGGRRLLERWGKKAGLVETKNGELTAAMVNVFLPGAPAPADAQEAFEQRKWYEDKLFEGNAFCAVFLHVGRPCARFSCQVWNELEDFDRIAEILEGAIEGIKQGKHRDIKINEEDLVHKKEDQPGQDA